MPQAATGANEQVYRKADPVACAVGERLLLVAPAAGVADLTRILALAGTARSLWEGAGDRLAAADLSSRLARDFGLSREQADRDAEAFLVDLLAHGLVRADSGGSDTALQGAAASRRPVTTGAATTTHADTTTDPVTTTDADTTTTAATTITADDVLSMARAVLGAGLRLRFRAEGHSMRPQLQSGSLLEVSPHPLAQVRLGEVVLYTVHTNGRQRLVAHRTVGLGHDGQTLLTRGDSAARVDRVDGDSYLGVVTARLVPRGGGLHRISLTGGVRRLSGLCAGVWHRLAGGAIRTLVVRPLRRSGALRAALGFCLRLVSSGLRFLERQGSRLRRRVDVWRSALLTSCDKDTGRRRLYATKAVQEFTALDENLEAGLTLIEEVMLSRHPLPPGPVLVLGCGPGRECVALAKRGHEVVGLDREPRMLERARALAKREGLEIRFEDQDADAFHLEGQRFGSVVIFSGLLNMVLPRSRRVAMLRAAGQHLLPGGKVLVTFLSDYVPPRNLPPRELPPRDLAAAPPPGAPTVWTAINPEHEEGDRYLLNEAVHIFPHPDRLRAEVRDAGLEVETLFRDQRAYDRETRQVRGYAILAPSIPRMRS